MTAILIKELRSFFRGGRPLLLLSLYILFSGGFVLMIYTGMSGSSFVNRADMGLQLFMLALGMALFQLTFLSPILNASSLGSERDQRTIDLLLVSPLRPLFLLIGKLAAPSLYLLLMALSVLPILAFTMLVGGIAPRDLVAAFAILTVTIIGFGSIAIWSTSRAATARGGILMALAIVLVIAFALPFMALISLLILEEAAPQGLADTIIGSPIAHWIAGAIVSLSPFVMMFSLAYVVEQGDYWWMELSLPNGHRASVPALWLMGVMMWLILIPLLLLLASRRLPRSVAKQGGG